MPRISPCDSSANQGVGEMATYRAMQNARKDFFDTCILQPISDGGFALIEDGSKNAAHLFSIR
jgi:hypothetical protein